MTRVLSAPLNVGARLNAKLDRLSDTRFALLSFLPGAVLIALLVLPPIAAVAGMSLFRIELGKDALTPFVGLRNYLVRLPADHDFIDSISRTVFFAIATTALAVPLGLFAALALRRLGRGATVFGIVLLLPWAVAPVVTGIYWRFMFTNEFGVVNSILQATGLPAVRWLDDTSTAIAIAIVATAWRSTPLLALLLLAALKTIPDSLYRAARMDGANSAQEFRFVTLPGIRNMLITVGILQVILGLQVFDILFTLTGGGPGRDTYVMTYYIYDNAFGTLSFGYASALTVVLFFIILLCSAALVYVRVRRPRDSVDVSDNEGEVLASTVRQLSVPRRATAVPPPVEAVAPIRSRRLGRWLAASGRFLRDALVVVMVVWLVAPIVWIAIASTQTEGALTSVPLALQPSVSLDGYAFLLASATWTNSLVVSLEVALVTTLAAIVLASLAAYPLARLNVRGKGALLSVLIFTQMVPAMVLAIPVLIIFQAIHLRDTPAALILVDIAWWLPLLIWLLRSVFEDVPRSIELAARMDGCSRIGTLFRIALPAARPGIAAAAILVLIGTWNEFLFAVVLGDRNAVTLTRWISFIESYTTPGMTQQPPFHLLAAAGLLTVLPCIVLVAIFHRRIVGGLTEGFGKG
jgi:multiple sugar transport system permease protein